MSELDVNGISARLWRLPKQLLLALVNATAILVIVAAIVALVAIARINHFAENIVATMTEAVLAKVDLPSRDVLANLRNLTTEVRTVGNALREIKTGEHPALQTEMVQLKEKLTVLNASINRLGSARSILTDEAIGQLGRTITDHEHVHNHTPFSPYADALPEGDDYYVYHLNHHGGSSHNADQS